MLVKLLVLLYALGSVYPETAVINGAVDKLLDEARAEIKRSGLDVMYIKDIRHPFSTRWHFVDVNWMLHCTDGWSNGISTLRRIGDIVLSAEGQGISVSFEMGMTDVELSFQECDISAKHLSHRMKLWSKVQDQQFKGNISLHVDDERNECNATLNSMQLTRIKGVSVKTGSGITSAINDRITELLIRLINDRFTRIISNHVNEIIRDYRLVDKVCDFIHDLNVTSTNY